MSSPEISTGDTTPTADMDKSKEENTPETRMEIDVPSQEPEQASDVEQVAKKATEAVARTAEEVSENEQPHSESGVKSQEQNPTALETKDTSKAEEGETIQSQDEKTKVYDESKQSIGESKVDYITEPSEEEEMKVEESAVEYETKQSAKEASKDDETKEEPKMCVHEDKAPENDCKQSTGDTTEPNAKTEEPNDNLKKSACPSSPKKSNSTDEQTAHHENAPFHWLMRPASEHPKGPLLEQTLPSNRKLRRDYLSRRYRAYHPRPYSIFPSHQDTAAGDKRGFSEICSSEVPLWSGATQLERALADCCELPPTQEDGDEEEGGGDEKSEEVSTEGATSSLKGGALARGYEVRFTGLIAKHCHSFESRVLALAILERSLEQDKEETVAALEASNEEEEIQAAAFTQVEEEEAANTSSDEEAEDDDWDPSEEGPKTRRSRRIQKRGRGRPPKRTRTKQNEDTKSSSLGKPGARKNKSESAKSPPKEESPPKKEAKEEEKVESEEDSKEGPHTDRLAVFLSAGGLKILKSWLMDSMTPILLSNAKPTPGSLAAQTKTPQPRKFKPSKYGPMLLPLLVLLKDIPFDKNLVVESKINKQIRRLSKQVDSLVDAFKKQNKGKDADALLEAHTDPGAGAGGLVVVQVQEALNKLKETWEEHAKNGTANPQEGVAIKDPYEDMKRLLQERLSALNAVEAGEAEKPQWLKSYEAAQKDRVKKRRKIPVKPKKTSTEQLALQEREAERAALKDKLKAAEEERKAHLQRLKNQISKRMSLSGSYGGSSAVPVRKAKKKNSKTVKWKDGLSSDKIRKREILEKVYILEQSAENAPERSKSKTEGKTPKEEPKEEEEIPLPTNDEHGLFEFDETLLL